MLNMKTAFITVAFALAHTASANTITDSASFIKTVNKVDIITAGLTLLNQALIKPVRLEKLEFVNASIRTKTESTIRGIVIQVDRTTGKGILREERTNRLVPFTFAQGLLENRVAVPSAGAYVEFTYAPGDAEIVAMK